MRSSRCLLGLVTLTVIVITAAATRAENPMGWVLGGKVGDPLGLSILNLSGDSGFQLAVLSSRLNLGTTHRFSVGIGYDDMVGTASQGEARQKIPITEQLFLLQTSCDKRVQLTLQFRW